MTTDIDAILTQRAELKQRDLEMIYLFRVDNPSTDDPTGKGYCAYEEDAVTLRDLKVMHGPIGQGLRGNIDLTLTRGKYLWIDWRDLQTALDRIVAAGKRAAVCEPFVGPVPTDEEIERIATTCTPTTAQAKLDEIQAVIAEFRAENVSSNLDVTGRAAVFTLGRIQGILVLARD